MTAMFVLDVPENDSLVRVAEQDPLLGVEKLGPYFRIVASGVTAATPAPEDGPLGAGRTSGPGEIVIDRRATGCRHAVWYSGVAGLERARIAQHDKNALRVVARAEEER